MIKEIEKIQFYFRGFDRCWHNIRQLMKQKKVRDFDHCLRSDLTSDRELGQTPKAKIL